MVLVFANGGEVFYIWTQLNRVRAESALDEESLTR
jgi:hypothetical protein